MSDSPSDFDILEYQEYLTQLKETKTCPMCGNDKVLPLEGESVELWFKFKGHGGRIPVLTYPCIKCGYIMLFHYLKEDVEKYQESKKPE